MVTTFPCNLEFPAVKQSRFARLPEVCHEQGYQLLRLADASAVIGIDGAEFWVYPSSIFAKTGFHASSERVVALVQARNRSLTSMGWVQHHQLVLFMPHETPTDMAGLSRAIALVACEVDQFGRKLRAHGIWHF